MYQEFFDFRSMRLIGRSGEVKLHGPDDLPGIASEDNAAATGINSRQNLAAPECLRVVTRKQQNETDAGARLHAGV
jgi:hypothetical protein